MTAPLPIDIISIQSEVVYGHVGNCAVIPVLQSRGFTTANVPTVYFSNTPHYPTLYGGIIPDDWFQGYLQALTERGILPAAKAILLGYLGSPSQADILADWLENVRRQHPNLFIQIDPVLGDVGCGLYVDERLAENYRSRLHQFATGMTPNHFELEYLAGRRLESLDDTIAAAKALLSDTTQWIIVTSAAPKAWQNGEIITAVITHDDAIIQTHRRYPTETHGTGDTFAATLAAELLAGAPLAEAAETASAQVLAALERTQSAGVGELKLIETLYNKAAL